MRFRVLSDVVVLLETIVGQTKFVICQSSSGISYIRGLTGTLDAAAVAREHGALAAAHRRKQGCLAAAHR